MGAQEAAGLFSHLAALVPLKLDFQGMTDLSPTRPLCWPPSAWLRWGRLALINRRACRQCRARSPQPHQAAPPTAVDMVCPCAFDPGWSILGHLIRVIDIEVSLSARTSSCKLMILSARCLSDQHRKAPQS